MGERIDYFNDPDAPKASSLVPSANVIVVNDQDEILLIRRTDNGNWAVPGGGLDLGESITDTAAWTLASALAALLAYRRRALRAAS